MSLDKFSFEESLYRALEGEDAASAANGLKQRLDRDPQFAQSFVKTQQTALSLQGLAAAPSSRGSEGFTQRDYDKLTRDILKGYKLKLAEILYQLGSAYLLEVPQRGFASHRAEPKISLDQEEERLVRTHVSFRSVVADQVHLLRTDESAKLMISSLIPTQLDWTDRALESLSTSRLLRPRFTRVWVQEGQAWLRKNEVAKAKKFSIVARELSANLSDKSSAISLQAGSLFFENQFTEMAELLEAFLLEYAVDEKALFNHALALVQLHDYRHALDRFARLLALAQDHPSLQKVCKLGIQAGSWKTWPKLDPATFEKFRKLIEMHLGSQVAVSMRGV